MEKQQIKRILDGANIDYSGLTQIPKLRTLFVNTPQGIDVRRDFIFFDLDNELVKIKKYHPTLAAGRLGSCEYGDISHTWLRATGNVFYLQHKEFSYKLPQEGDILFTVNKATGNIDKKYNIKSVGSHYIESETKIEYNQHSQYLCYTTQEDYNSMVQDELDKSVFLKYKPATKNKYDIFLDMNQVIGFEFISERLGNS